jgi:hypothetical protein
LLLASLSASSLLAGCGGGSQPPPRLSRVDAAPLVAIARRVVRDAPRDGCAARSEIAALRARTRALVASGRVPLRLRAPLLAGVAAVAADAPACRPPQPQSQQQSQPSPAPAAPVTATPSPPSPRGRGHPHEHRGHGEGHGKAKEHGHGHGHGHDGDEDK